MRDTRIKLHGKINKVPLTLATPALSLVLSCTVLGSSSLSAGENQENWRESHGQRHCSNTAKAVQQACRAEVRDDLLIAKAICINVGDEQAREDCRHEARETFRDEQALCHDQYRARLDLCDGLGEQRYDPDFNAEDFVDPDVIGATVAANPYFPLVPGTRWVYESGDEVITVQVTERTKLIDGVTCRVVNDVVAEHGQVIEDTDDWYAQHVNGDVWYCGELARDFETFEGDEPEQAELISIEGSFKAGRDGDKPGILVKAAPQSGEIYRQEVSLGNAEDAAEVVSVTGSEVVPAASCNGDCLVTREFTPIEPGAEAFKYYAPGVGTILEVSDSGERTELVEFSRP